MADRARPVPASARASHAKRNSQVEFSNRLKHLQRSDPVNAAELTSRLNAVIEEARNGVQSNRRRVANLSSTNNNNSRSKSPSQASTPRRNARQATFASVEFPRASLMPDAQNDEDQMSRVANALRVCRDSDPQRPFLNPAQHKDEDERRRKETAAKAQNEMVGVPPTLTRGSVIFAAPQVVAMEKPMDFLPRSPSVRAPPNIANAMKKRTSRKAPPPLILTSMPKAAKAEIVDVTSPITTKLTSTLPNLEPLSPFGPNFTENAGTFLVYQPQEIRHSALSMSSEGLSSAGLDSQVSPGLFTSPSDGAVTQSNNVPRVPTRPAPTLKDVPGNQSGGAREGRKEQPERQVSHPTVDRTKLATQENTRGRKHIPNIMLHENSETEETDGQSETAVSPIFDVSDAQSSRTSFGHPSSTARTELKRVPSKRTGFSPAEFADMGYEAALTQNFANPTSSKPSPPVSPLHRAIDGEPIIDDGQDISPLTSPSSVTIPKRMSSLPPVQQQSPNPNRFSIPRKPISGYFDDAVGDDTIKQFYPPATRHDSTGFTAAREYIRDSVDGDHVRLVQSAAHRRSNGSSVYSEPASKPQELPKLTTPGNQRGQWELIADGIALIDSESPIVGRVNQKLPTPTATGFRASVYTREAGGSPYASEQNLSTAGDRQTQRLSSTQDQAQLSPQLSPPSVDVNESPAVALKRVLSRDRRGTDATITSLSSRPDFRARPLIQDAPNIPSIPTVYNRPRTAGSARPTPTPLPSLPSKMPTKIKFPPRANVAELGAMSPESLKLLHEQEALLQKRYDAVLNPIDSALKKKPSESAPNSAVQAPKKHNHTRSKSVEILSTMQPSPQMEVDPAFTRRQEQIAREQAAIRMQRRNLGAAARRPSGPDAAGYHDPSPMESEPMMMFGEPMGLPGDFPNPDVHTKSVFTFDDDMSGKRRKGKWKFWKAK